MNQMKWAMLVGVCYVCTIGSLASQSFNKQWIYKQGQSVLQEKLKMAPETLDALLSQEPGNWPQPQSSQALSFREDENNLSGTEAPESEVHAAINPRDTNNIIVAAMQLDAGQVLSSLSFPIYYTKDFGHTWQTSGFDGVSDLPPFTLVIGGGDPVLAFDSDGTAYLSWLTFTINLNFTIGIQLQWATSTDGGATWQRQASTIDEGTVVDLEAPDSRFVDKQWMATDLSDSPYRDNLYAAYVEINLADTAYNILVKTKVAGADSFGAAVDVTPPEIVFSQFASIDVDRQGKAHVLFAGAEAQDQVLSLYHCYSTDGGQSFSEPVKISPLHLPCFPPGAGGPCDLVGVDSARVYPCPHLRVDRSGGDFDGNLYAVWTADGFQNELTTGVDVYFSRSENGGQNWSAPFVLNNDGIPASEQFFPSLAVNDKGLLAISWYDRREDPNNLMTKYYMTYSTDGGASFEQDFPVSSEGADFSSIGAANGNFGVGEYTQIVTTQGYAIPVWADGRSNDGNIEIFAAFLPLGGEVTGLPEISSITDKFAVGLPSPNPGKGVSQITIELKEATAVVLQLFGSQGRLLQQQAFGELPVGNHQLDINLEGMSQGAYLLRVQTALGIQSRRLVVTR